VGYALANASLRDQLGKIRMIRLDLDEFEEDLRHFHLPVDRVPGFALVNRAGKIVDYIDAGEWKTNNPAEFVPILRAFLRGNFRQRLHPRSIIGESGSTSL
jgi:hypothetical protein